MEKYICNLCGYIYDEEAIKLRQKKRSDLKKLKITKIIMTILNI